MSAEPSDVAPAHRGRRFTGRERDYRTHRPGYARGAVELLLSSEGLGDWQVVADIGSGTGKLAGQLLAEEHAPDLIYAVEPNQAMRDVAEQQLGGDPRFRAVDGTGEATGLEGNAVTAITVAQAFHWFDFERARREFRRVARSGARCAVLWNMRSEDHNEFHRAYEAFLLEWGVGYREVRETWRVSERMAGLFAEDYRLETFSYDQPLTSEGLLGRFQSSSYAPSEEHPRHAPARDRLAALFADYAAQTEGTDHATLQMRYRCEVHVGTL